jgi:hypothetical protein
VGVNHFLALLFILSDSQYERLVHFETIRDYGANLQPTHLIVGMLGTVGIPLAVLLGGILVTNILIKIQTFAMPSC